MAHFQKVGQEPLDVYSTRNIKSQWRIDGRKTLLRSPGLPVPVAVRKKPSSQSVPSSLVKPNAINPAATARTGGSDVNISATRVPVPTRILKSKLASKNEKESMLRQNNKTGNLLETKRQDFLKFRRKFIEQQMEYIDRYAHLRDIEAKSGISTSALGEVRVLSLTDWPLHDLLLAAESAPAQQHDVVKGDLIRVSAILQHLNVQVSEIRKEILAMGGELMGSRMEILKYIRAMQRNDSSSKWQTKNAELDAETSRLQDLILTTVQNVEIKLTQSLDAAKIPWMDRHNILKKIESLQKELETLRKFNVTDDTNDKKLQKLSEELVRERATCIRLKEVIANAEGRAETQRSRAAQLDCNTNRTKWTMKAKTQHSNCGGASQHSYFKKSELNAEILSSQRDALQLKIKELKEDAAEAKKREVGLMSRLQALQAKLDDEEQRKHSSEKNIKELEIRFKNLQEQYDTLQQHARVLLEAQKTNCIEYLPKKGIEILCELLVTESELGRVKQLERFLADKEDFVKLYRSISEMRGDCQNEEQKIAHLKTRVNELTEKNKSLEDKLASYENKISALQLEVSALRNCHDYKSYDQQNPHEELERQVFDLCLQVQRLTREREALASESRSRALLLERHERCAELFACVTRAKHALNKQLGPYNIDSASDSTVNPEIASHMLKSHLTSANTWSALRAERARVMRLEGVVHAQAQQLERESRVRIKQDRRRAQLERELLRTWAITDITPSVIRTIKEDIVTSDSLYPFKVSPEDHRDSTEEKKL